MFLTIVFVLLSLILFVHPKWFVLRAHRELPPSVRDTLAYLGTRSLETRDVPVAALLFYGRQIIGEGYNTVMRNQSAGEHAEINAISDAIRQMGMEKFLKLDRDSLYLISTYEPCPMCRGAFLLYGIKHVSFLKEKPFFYNLKREAAMLRYFYTRRKVSGGGLQDSLFRLHPDYPGKQ